MMMIYKFRKYSDDYIARPECGEELEMDSNRSNQVGDCGRSWKIKKSGDLILTTK